MRELVGSRQEIFLEVAPSVFINRGYYVSFLMKSFFVTENILQKNLLVILQSVEMTVVLQVHAVLHIDIGLPIQRLTSNTHELGE